MAMHGDRKPHTGGWNNWWADLRIALVFLTRFPIRIPTHEPARPLAEVATFFPVAGALVGLCGGLVFGIADLLGLPSLLAAVLAVAAMVLATGGLHEDALADVADGFGAGGARDRILTIMRDSRVGTYGVLALILATTARIGALMTLADPTLVLAVLLAAGAASRTAAVGLMVWLPAARSDGLGATAGKPGAERFYVAATIAVLAGLLFMGIGATVTAAIVGGSVAVLLGRLALKRIGGHTGDVLGAAVQLCEIGVLLAAVAVLA